LTDSDGLSRELDQFDRLISIAEELPAEIAATRDPEAYADQVARLQQGFLALSQLFAAPGEPAPAEETVPRQRSEATDATGTVRVVVAPDGLPESITVGEDWRRTVGSEGFAAAVTEACRNAAAAQALSEPEPPAGPVERDGADRLDRAKEIVAFVEGDPRADLPPVDLEEINPRPLSSIIEEALRAADAVSAMAASWVPEEVPPNEAPAGHRLSLAVAPFGLLSCTADPAWVGRQETADLEEALAAALRFVRSRHAESLAASPEAVLSALPDFSRLFAEIHALRSSYENPR
jgi:hypothetical protein